MNTNTVSLPITPQVNINLRWFSFRRHCCYIL